MRICLISQDKKADRIFRETLAGIGEAEYEFAPSPDQAAPADIWVRDFDLPEAAPRSLEPESEPGNVFLVRLEDLEKFHERYPLAAAAILPKPLKKAAARVFLERAIERRKRFAARSDPRRADRDELFECLLLSSLKVQQHNAERTNFIARALHDFRAPLTAANGYCGLLIDQALGPLTRDQLETLRRMQHSIQRLSGMADAMFQLSLGKMIETGPKLAPGDLAGSIEQAVYEIMPPADARDIEVTVDIARPSGPLLFDHSQIEQVLVNLLENACKFTPRRGSIEVRGYPVAWTAPRFRFMDGDGVWYRPAPAGEGLNAYRLDVKDAGPGIPPEQLGRIFEHGVSYGGSQDRSGTGLGLATCRLIAAAHHGEVFAESRGEGAVFSLVLPFIRREAASGMPEREGVLAGASQ